MNRIALLGIVLPLFGLAACTQETAIDTPIQPADESTEQPVPIVLTSMMNDIKTSTRAAINTSYTGSLSFLRSDQTGASTYSNFKGTDVITGTRAANGTVTFTNQCYQVSATNNNTKLIGWYPTGTYDKSGGKITIPIDGRNDIIYGASAAGNKTTGIPTFALDHKLTQIEVRAYGTADAYTAWGNITGITTTSTGSNFIVTLGTGDAVASATVDATAKSNIALMTASDASVGAVSSYGGKAKAAAVSCGFAIIAPMAANAKLTLSVTTAKGATQTAEVTVPAGGFAAANSYVIYLELTVKGINPSVTIANWTTSSTETDAQL